MDVELELHEECKILRGQPASKSAMGVMSFSIQQHGENDAGLL